jgi:hypothetical protein
VRERPAVILDRRVRKIIPTNTMLKEDHDTVKDLFAGSEENTPDPSRLIDLTAVSTCRMKSGSGAPGLF